MALLSVFCFSELYAQEMKQDTLSNGNIVVVKDERFDVLSNKMLLYNQSLAKKTRIMPGFRLMLMSTTDRNKAMALRAKLLQLYPDQKIYTLFLSPYIKVKFGNFLTKEEAKSMQKQLADAGIVEGNIYLVAEKIEVRPDKQKDESNGDGQ